MKLLLSLLCLSWFGSCGAVSTSIPVMSSSQDAFGWCANHLASLGPLFGNGGDARLRHILLEKLSSRTVTLTTAFSGSGAPERAIECLRCELLRGCIGTESAGLELHVDNLASVEWNSDSRQELLVHQRLLGTCLSTKLSLSQSICAED